ncbi:hypothetical protein E5D57_002710 [Metarhizium anisopliae]|nr:hypothetical protein E5D57_002710 [Metarhizium anisopliae]
MQLALVSAFAGLALAGPLGARQETLKPFKQPGKKTDIALCGSGTFWGDAYKWKTEGCQGTLIYCQRKLFQEFGESFGSTEECLQSREPGSPVNQTKPTRDELAGAPVVKDGLSPLCQEKGGSRVADKPRNLSAKNAGWEPLMDSRSAEYRQTLPAQLGSLVRIRSRIWLRG